jgi:hypothetical protein
MAVPVDTASGPRVVSEARFYSGLVLPFTYVVLNEGTMWQLQYFNAFNALDNTCPPVPVS